MKMEQMGKVKVRGALYKLDFASGKSYIGITVQDPLVRFSDHERAARNGEKLSVCCAWRKYGAPTMTILAILEKQALKDAEQKAIRVFGTFGKGYNMTTGGEIPAPMTPEWAANIRASWTPERRAQRAIDQTGRKHTAESIEKMRSSQKSLNKHYGLDTRAKLSKSTRKHIAANGNPFFGKTHTDETKARLSDTAKNRSPEVRQKVRERLLGKPLPQTVRDKMRTSHTGLKHSPEQKQAILEAVGRASSGRFCKKGEQRV